MWAGIVVRMSEILRSRSSTVDGFLWLNCVGGHGAASTLGNAALFAGLRFLMAALSSGRGALMLRLPTVRAVGDSSTVLMGLDSIDVVDENELVLRRRERGV